MFGQLAPRIGAAAQMPPVKTLLTIRLPIPTVIASRMLAGPGGFTVPAVAWLASQDTHLPGLARTRRAGTATGRLDRWPPGPGDGTECRRSVSGRASLPEAPRPAMSSRLSVMEPHPREGRAGRPDCARSPKGGRSPARPHLSVSLFASPWTRFTGDRRFVARGSPADASVRPGAPASSATVPPATPCDVTPLSCFDNMGLTPCLRNLPTARQGRRGRQCHACSRPASSMSGTS